MSELPESWVWARFGDVATVESFLVDPGRYRDAPHVAPNHIESGTGVLLPYKTVEEDAVTSPKHLFEPGQILYSKIRPYLAKAVLVDFAGLCSADMYPVATPLEAAYLHRWLVSPEFTQWTSQNQGRTLLPKINQDALKRMPVPVPPRAEQRRIVAKIEALTSHSRRAKEELDAIPGLLEDFRRSLLAAAFRGDLTAEWRAKHPDVEPADKLLTRIRAERRRRWEEAELAKMQAKGKTPGDDRWKEKYEEPAPVDAEGLPELPDGWCWAGLEELCAGDAPIVYGIILPGDDVPDGIPYLRPVDVRDDGSVDFTSVKRTSPEIARQYERASLKAGDVILSIVGTIGKVVITPRELEGGNITQSSVRVRAAPGILTDFMRFALLSPHMRKQYDRHRFGNAVQRLNVEHVRRLIVPVPPKEEQKAIVAGVSVGLQSSPSESILDLRSQLSYLNRSILAKAFRGELVPQDPSDEPASVLLDRIRAERAQAEAAPKGEPAARKRKKP